MILLAQFFEGMQYIPLAIVLVSAGTIVGGIGIVLGLLRRSVNAKKLGIWAIAIAIGTEMLMAYLAGHHFISPEDLPHAGCGVAPPASGSLRGGRTAPAVGTAELIGPFGTSSSLRTILPPRMA